MHWSYLLAFVINMDNLVFFYMSPNANIHNNWLCPYNKLRIVSKPTHILYINSESSITSGCILIQRNAVKFALLLIKLHGTLSWPNQSKHNTKPLSRIPLRYCQKWIFTEKIIKKKTHRYSPWIHSFPPFLFIYRVMKIIIAPFSLKILM